MSDFSTIESIFLMMEPAGLTGARKLSLGKKVGDGNVIKSMVDVVYNAGASGAMPASKMIPKLNELCSKSKDRDPAAVELFKKTIHVFSSENIKLKEVDPGKDRSTKRDGSSVQDKTTFDQIVGPDVKLEDKKMSVFRMNSSFLSLAYINAERCEIFLNSIPSIHASRMVPVLEVELSFVRVGDSTKETFGMTRFLLGGTEPIDGSPTAKMHAARTVSSLDKKVLTTTAGMEMFTSPQTLVSIDKEHNARRYADIIDPFRPFATIESFTVNVTPTVGMYSYKKATLIVRLHDRSRLAEIADLVRPQIYQSAATSPTVWVTYGWRCPVDQINKGESVGSQSYADFINNNMLVREAYGVANSQYAFDNSGQVLITLELWTKGVGEMKTIRITDKNDGMRHVQDRIEQAMKNIARYANEAGVGNPQGISTDVRPYMIIDAAERGTFPDMSNEQIKKALKSLEDGFKKKNVDSAAAKGLIDELKKYYTGSDKKNLDVKAEAKNVATNVAKQKFDEVMKGEDPFLPSAKKDEKNPIASECDSYNKQSSGSPVKEFKKRCCSLGKLFSVFISHMLLCNDSVDELQLFFHQFNDKAGNAASTNIAEFPIEMPVFFDQYRDAIEAKRSENLTLEEFLKLVIDAQVNDERSLAYGFRSYFAPYDPATKSPKLKENSQDAYETALTGADKVIGPFMKPVVEMYVETTYASDSIGNDLLRRFEAQETGNEGARQGQLTRVMRIHVFDRCNNPYKTQTQILRAASDTNSRYLVVSSEFAKALTDKATNDRVIAELSKGAIKSKGDDVVIDIDLMKSSQGPYTAIKQLVSTTMPSIVFGSNASMVINANLASKQDALLAAAQMSGMGKSKVGMPNGGGQGGLPLRIIPASLSMLTMGCPTLGFGQLFFVDFNTGTTVDNIYGLTEIVHNMSVGKFESQLKLTFADAYGRYEGAASLIDLASKTEVPAKKKKK